MRVAAGVRGNAPIRPEPARVVGRRGTLGALTETMEGSDTAGRAMFRLEACVRGGAARSARVRVRAGTAENLARLGWTTVEDRRAVGSRAVARAAAREGSDGPRRGEHETRVPRVSPRSLRARAVVTSPEAPRARRRQAVRCREPRERESAHAGVKKHGRSPRREGAHLGGCLGARGPAAGGGLDWRRGHGGHGGRHLTTYNDKQRRAHD